MRPSLALLGGIVVVSRPVEGVGLFDLDGHRLAGDLRPHALRGAGRARLAGVALDGDKRLWVCDPQAGALRGFSAFGREFARLVDPPGSAAAPRDAAGALGRPWCVAARGDADGLWLLVGSRERRRHALQLFDERGALRRSLRPEGGSHGSFDALEGVALDGRFAYALGSSGRLSVYRDLEHHFSFDATASADGPRAVAPAGGGRTAVLCERLGVLLFDAAGRPVANPVRTGDGEGLLDHPSDLVVERGRADARRRVVVVDRDGERVQVFSLAGECYGSFCEL